MGLVYGLFPGFPFNSDFSPCRVIYHVSVTALVLGSSRPALMNNDSDYIISKLSVRPSAA